MFSLLFALHLLQVTAMSWVNLSIEVKGLPENDVILLTPLNNSLFLPFSLGSNELKQTGSKMHFKVAFEGNSFFMLKINNEMRIPLALKGGDSLFISISRNPKANYIDYDFIF